MKLRQGNVFTHVYQSFCSWGVSPSVHALIHPWAGTPPGQVHPLGRYTLGRKTPSPRTGTHPFPGQVHPKQSLGRYTPPTTVTAEDDTHPTGMLSCIIYLSVTDIAQFVGFAASEHVSTAADWFILYCSPSPGQSHTASHTYSRYRALHKRMTQQ